jgi:hypothetical protein
MSTHPAGITLLATGAWKATPVVVYDEYEHGAWRSPEHYA